MSSPQGDEARFRTILNAIPDAVITIDQQGLIQTVNPATTILFGYTDSELVGKNINILMPSPHRENHDNYIEDYLDTGTKHTIWDGREAEGQHKNGNTFPIFVTINEFRIDGKIYFSGIIHDLSSLRKAEDDLKKSNRSLLEQAWLQEGLVKLYEAIRGENTLDGLCQIFIDSLIDYVDAEVGGLYTLENEQLFWKAGYAYPNKRDHFSSIALGEGMIGQAALDKKARYIKPSKDNKLTIVFSAVTVQPKEIAILPVLFNNETVAVVELGTLKRFTPIQRSFLSSIAETLAISINSVQRYEYLHRLVDETRAQAEELQVQQEELQQTNEELEEKTNVLSEQKAEIEAQKKSIEQAKSAVEEQAHQLATASKYKSEFLANMSHELRTPLNSLLILSEQLTKNKPGNLNDKQIQFARTIYESGSELLHLINDILDLSKIEAGAMTVAIEDIKLTEIEDKINRSFEEWATQSKIGFNVHLAANLPPTISTDKTRLLQMLKNLLSNAFKFTPAGKVTLSVYPAQSGWDTALTSLSQAETVIAFSVTDTGIGIDQDKQEIIFDAFQQVDGSISREYAGTGLGLSITRQMAELLQGQLSLASEKNKGSTFTLYLPSAYNKMLKNQPSSSIVTFAQPTIELANTDSNRQPTVKIPCTQHLDQTDHCRSTVLVVGEATGQYIQQSLQEEGAKTQVLITKNNDAAARALKQQDADCLIIDFDAPDIDGFLLLKTASNIEASTLPIIIYTATPLSEQQELELSQITQSIIIKGDKAYDRLLEETRLSLQHSGESQPNAKPIIVSHDIEPGKELAGKKILVIDDDMRNVFAMSTILEDQAIEVSSALTGKKAIELLTANNDIDAILVDIMMPELNGHETMQAIRKIPNYSKTPIIAVTAKVTEGEHSKCLSSGASDYMTKPIDTQRLLSLLKVWLFT
ncbi:MAG: hypothetical protein CMF50_05175 [Legionellales bacterium]|nr:hypothetical protein [Legionellales bacterium]|tara:strand:- start:84223 stop:87000 length:2778 start_codon:yes stop_codon:yes gene_type:complete